MGPERFDIVIIGAGFAGAIMSMVLQRLGFSVLLLERHSHPRFVIGESSTPFANLLLERIAECYDLPFLRTLSEWGSWRRSHPNLPVGLKRGFTFYHHLPGEKLHLLDRARQLLVAASPHDEIADTHWYRPAFDEFLVSQAQAMGVSYLDRASLLQAMRSGGAWHLEIQTGATVRKFAAGFVIDASGPHSAFAKQLGLTSTGSTSMPPTSAVYAHFRKVRRLDDLCPQLRNAPVPYPPDDAAVHHLFPGGWIWVLRFNNDITSAGAAFIPDPKVTCREPREQWQKRLEQLPLLRDCFQAAEPLTEFHYLPQLSFRRPAVAGDSWALLPSAAGFVDPLLSTGFALTLLGIWRLGEYFRHGQPSLSRYEQLTLQELDAASDLISALYATMSNFDDFARLTLLYFAALSYTESAWRLRRERLADAFLLSNNEAFSVQRALLCAQARQGAKISHEQILNMIAPFDIAGLTDPSRMPWYPVEPADLLSNAHKLGASEQEVGSLLAKMRCPADPRG